MSWKEKRMRDIAKDFYEDALYTGGIIGFFLGVVYGVVLMLCI